MSPEKEKIDEFIRSRASEIDKNGDLISETFNEYSLKTFKGAVKDLRSFLDLLRLHRGEKSMKLPEKVKKLYLIAGGLLELYHELADLESQPEESMLAVSKCKSLIAAQKSEWKKTWPQGGFAKLYKDLIAIDISVIPEPIINNFLSRHSAEREVERQQSFQAS